MASEREKRIKSARINLLKDYIKNGDNEAPKLWQENPILPHSHPVSVLMKLVTRWIETDNPAYVDWAVEICDKMDLPIERSLRFHLAEAAEKRRKGKFPKPYKELVKEEAMLLVATLVVHGATLETACGKTAAKYAVVFQAAIESGLIQGSEFTMKASTLEKAYIEHWRCGKPSKEDEWREFHRQNPEPEMEKGWDEILNNMRPPTASEKGVRR